MTLAEESGLGVVREDYAFMRAFALFFADPGAKAHLLADLAVESAMQSGAERTEMLAREIRAEMRLAAADLAGLRADIERLADLLDRDPERRFASDLQVLRAALAWREGDVVEARAHLAPLVASARANPYNGPMVLGLAALLASDAADRDAAIAAGGARVTSGALSHAILWFHRLVLECALRVGVTKLARAQIRALRDYAGDESLGFCELLLETAELALKPADRAEIDAQLARLLEARLADLGALLSIVRAGAAPGP